MLAFLMVILMFAEAAPIAAVLVDQKSFKSSLGFSLSNENTDWKALPTPTPPISFLYRGPQIHNGVQPALTVRADVLPSVQSPKTYAHQWMKDYYRLGFDVLNSKPVSVSGNDGFLIDAIHRQSARRLRQIIFLKNKVAVVLTCRDHVDGFEQSLKTCNTIARSFHWTN